MSDRRRTIKEHGPDPIDAHVGSRLRTHRMSLRISQTKLGNELGVTFQQIQKYENGTNRLGASNLYKSAKFLGVGVDYFFEGLDGSGITATKSEGNAMKSPESARFARDVMRVPDAGVRRRMGELLKAVVRAES